MYIPVDSSRPRGTRVIVPLLTPVVRVSEHINMKFDLSANKIFATTLVLSISAQLSFTNSGNWSQLRHRYSSSKQIVGHSVQELGK